MLLFEWLNKIDTQALLGVNGANNAFFDNFFMLFTSKEIWFPFYLVMLIVVFSKYKKTGLWLALMLILTIVISDQVSGIIKDLLHRYRPSHEPALSGLLNLPIGQRGAYGFVSAHASNSFALTVMVGLVSKCKRLWPALLIWAIITSYSRVYLGVHYPLDVICGAMLGSGVGWGMYKLTMLLDDRFLAKKIAFSGSCENHQITPVILSLLMITVTIAMAAMIMLKYQQ